MYLVFCVRQLSPAQYESRVRRSEEMGLQKSGTSGRSIFAAFGIWRYEILFYFYEYKNGFSHMHDACKKV